MEELFEYPRRRRLVWLDEGPTPRLHRTVPLDRTYRFERIIYVDIEMGFG
jgi:hypothetical protein